MADYNRNQRGSYRTSNQDWSNENRGRSSRYYDEDDRGYGWSENRGYGNSSNRDTDEDSGWQSRYERGDYRGSNMGSQRYGNQYDTSSNYGDRFGSSSYGNYGGQSSYDRDRGNRERDRNLYDRDYEGAGRSSYSNSGTRFGAGNYGSYGDQSRGYSEGRNEGRGYGGGYSGGNYYGSSPGYRNREDRTWWDRATDEVSSWFGDDDAERRRERDRMTRGEHRGKGPKNYSRSDDRIKDDINDRLADDPFIDASEIEVTVASGEVTLTGTVADRSEKRRAEDLAESVSGVKNVENRLRAGKTSEYRNPETQTETSGTTGTSSQSTSGVAGSEKTRTKSYVTG